MTSFGINCHIIVALVIETHDPISRLWICRSQLCLRQREAAIRKTAGSARQRPVSTLQSWCYYLIAPPPKSTPLTNLNSFMRPPLLSSSSIILFHPNQNPGGAKLSTTPLKSSRLFSHFVIYPTPPKHTPDQNYINLYIPLFLFHPQLLQTSVLCNGFVYLVRKLFLCAVRASREEPALGHLCLVHRNFFSIFFALPLARGSSSKQPMIK